MLIHIVCWKYKPETTPEMRAEHIANLRALGDIVPGIESLDVGADFLGLDRSFDTGLVIKFTGRDALENYTVHPEHQKVVAVGREIAERAVSVDFET
ncbi:MAG: Dabb family protein [Acidobacteria bacterium]|nr:Dabb family protein [Acidobacteriota bacterium]